MFEYVLFEFVMPFIYLGLLKTGSVDNLSRAFIALAVMIMVIQHLKAFVQKGRI